MLILLLLEIVLVLLFRLYGELEESVDTAEVFNPTDPAGDTVAVDTLGDADDVLGDADDVLGDANGEFTDLFPSIVEELEAAEDELGDVASFITSEFITSEFPLLPLVKGPVSIKGSMVLLLFKDGLLFIVEELGAAEDELGGVASFITSEFITTEFPLLPLEKGPVSIKGSTLVFFGPSMPPRSLFRVRRFPDFLTILIIFDI